MTRDISTLIAKIPESGLFGFTGSHKIAVESPALSAKFK